MLTERAVLGFQLGCGFGVEDLSLIQGAGTGGDHHGGIQGNRGVGGQGVGVLDLHGGGGGIDLEPTVSALGSQSAILFVDTALLAPQEAGLNDEGGLAVVTRFQGGKNDDLLVILHYGAHVQLQSSVFQVHLRTASVIGAYSGENILSPDQALAEYGGGAVLFYAQIDGKSFGQMGIGKHVQHIPGIPAHIGLFFEFGVVHGDLLNFWG